MSDRTYTEFQVTAQIRRERLLMQLAELMAGPRGLSLNNAARQLGESPATLCVWRQKFARDGREALIPKQADKCGRKPLAVLSDEHQRIVQGLTIKTDPNTGDRVSVSMALRMFAHSDACPEDVAAVIQKARSSKHTITPTLKRQARVTAESKMLDRGNKNFSLGAFSQPRALTWIDADGATKQILAGDLFEADDMTLNQPWYVEWHDPEDPCSAKFGVKLLRGQLLVMIDVGSQRVLGFLLLARQKDSYRGEDIWSWFGQVFHDVGLPRVGMRLERGIWESNAVHGLPILDDAWSQERRLGGLSELGVRRITSFSPKTKSIESLFNNLQKVLGVVGVQVGRRRGEYEKPTRDYLACRDGRKHPAACGFLHADELAKRIANACMFLNQDCREGEVYKGIPDDLWATNVASNPLRGVEPRKAWIFMGEKRPATLNNGMVRCRFAEHECSYWFTHPELFASLGKGYRVIVCFDPGNPNLGAVIFNNEVGPRAHTGAAAGELLGVAEFVDRVPQFSMLDGFDDERGYERRRRFTAQCRKHYRAIPLPGQRATSATIARDGRGNETRVETLRTAGCGARANPEDGVDMSPHVSPASAENLLATERATRSGVRGRAPAPAKPFDEENELARVAKLERAAVERGDILVT